MLRVNLACCFLPAQYRLPSLLQTCTHELLRTLMSMSRVCSRAHISDRLSLASAPQPSQPHLSILCFQEDQSPSSSPLAEKNPQLNCICTLVKQICVVPVCADLFPDSPFCSSILLAHLHAHTTVAWGLLLYKQS